MKLLAKKKSVTCYCDFCGKSDDDVEKMIDGKHAFICSGCVHAALAVLGPRLHLVANPTTGLLEQAPDDVAHGVCTDH